MGLLKLLTSDPAAFVLLIIPLLFSIIIHEVAHGWVAYKMGDPTAKWMGRLTLNPARHLDPIGTLALFLVGFGWAKPVPINIDNIPNRRKGLVFVSAAGVAANFLIACAAQVCFRFNSSETINILLSEVFYINVILASLNLIPIPPLDGSKILMGIAPAETQNFLRHLEPYGFFIIAILLFTGLLNPLIDFIAGIIVTVIGLLL